MQYKPILSQVFLRLVSAFVNDTFNHFHILYLMPNRDIRSYLYAFYLHFLSLPRYVPIFWSRREWVKVSVGKNIVAPLFERASGACGYYFWSGLDARVSG